jgi:hypothetical protein
MAACLLAALMLAPPASANGPTPGSPEYIQRDNQNILDAYGRHKLDSLEPAAGSHWQPVTLKRTDRLSFYFCSGYSFQMVGGQRVDNTDIAAVGGC